MIFQFKVEKHLKSQQHVKESGEFMVIVTSLIKENSAEQRFEKISSEQRPKKTSIKVLSNFQVHNK